MTDEVWGVFSMYEFRFMFCLVTEVQYRIILDRVKMAPVCIEFNAFTLQ